MDKGGAYFEHSGIHIQASAEATFASSIRQHEDTDVRSEYEPVLSHILRRDNRGIYYESERKSEYQYQTY